MGGMKGEKLLESRVKAYLHAQGAYFVKYFGCGYTRAGVPDLLVCHKGRFMGIELKADKGKPSHLQIMNLFEIREAGGIAILLFPKDFDAFKAYIEQGIDPGWEDRIFDWAKRLSFRICEKTKKHIAFTKNVN